MYNKKLIVLNWCKFVLEVTLRIDELTKEELEMLDTILSTLFDEFSDTFLEELKLSVPNV